ncbi:MAG: hypothetical protein Q4P71_01110 [Actinomycetaceae bacterium]|nr:hypothetical protein [Actinomycetaceae bacterium]
MSANSARESGRISVLILMLSLVVIAFVLTSATITTVHVQRRALYTCADAVALTLASELDSRSYYLRDSGEHHTDPHSAALAIVADLSDTTCAIGLSPRVDHVQVEEWNVTVELSVIPTIDLLPRWIKERTHPPRIRVASTAQLP